MSNNEDPTIGPVDGRYSTASLAVAYQQAMETYLEEELEQAPESEIPVRDLCDDFQRWYQATTNAQPPAQPWIRRTLQACGLETEHTTTENILVGRRFSGQDAG